MYQQYPSAVPQASELTRHNYRQLRRHSLFVGICLLGYFALQEILTVVMMFFKLGDAYNTVPAFQYALGAFAFSFVAMFVPFFFYSLRKGRASYFNVLPFHTPQPRKKLILIVLAGWAICIGGNYIATLASFLFDAVGVELFTPDVTPSSTPLDVIMNFVCAGFMAPLVEEFVFRGVIMQPLRRYGDVFAVLVTAALFALAHGNPVSVIFAFVAGVSIGFAVTYTRSLWVGIIIHALNNFTSVLVTEVERFAPDAINVAYTVFCTALTVVGIICIVIYGRNYGFRLSRDTSGVSGGKKLFGFFVTATMIPALLYLLYTMSKYFL